MATDRKPILEFEGYRLDNPKRVLLDRNGEPIKLMPKAFDILTFLVENNDRVVSKDELLAAIWPDAVVEENNLTQNISALRRVFGEKPQENRFISTVAGRGYRFVAEVRPIEANDVDTNEDAAPKPGWRLLLFMGAAAAIALLIYFGYTYYSDAGEVRSLAVLPFKPITLESRDEALELGMAESLIAKLGAGKDVRVLPLAAVRGFSSPDTDPQSAGRKIGVDAVLDGVMQIAGDRIRVSAKLIRVADGRQLWAAQFDEKLGDIFAVQDSISQRVASALSLTLSIGGRSAGTTNPEAYQLFMRGKYHAYRLILTELQKGIGYYEQAISLDPNYAMAYVELANAYRAMVLTNDASPSEMMPRAKAAATKAIELDENLAEAWTALAFSDFWFDWDWPAAESHFKRALDLDPNSAQARAYYAHMLSNIGRHSEAAQEIRRAREIDPINLLFGAMEGQILFFAGREADSTVVLGSINQLDPNFWLAHLFIARNYISKGMLRDALVAATRALEITRGNAEATGTAGYVFAKMGRADEARQLLAELEGRRDKPFLAYSKAQVYLGLGDRDRTLDLLEQAYKQREPLMIFLKVEPKWDELRSDARFLDLLKRLNFD